MSKTILRNVLTRKVGQGGRRWRGRREGGVKGEGEQEETVAKALHGQRFPMPHYQFLRYMSYSVSFVASGQRPRRAQ